MDNTTYKAYDLPCLIPVAEELSSLEATRFSDKGFLVIPQADRPINHRPLESQNPKDEYTVMREAADQLQARRAARLKASRPGTARKRASTT